MPLASSTLAYRSCSGVSPSATGKCRVVLSRARASLTVSSHRRGVGVDMHPWPFMHPMLVRSWPFLLAMVCDVPCVLVDGHGSDGLVLRVLEVGVGHPRSWRLLGVNVCNKNPLIDIGR